MKGYYAIYNHRSNEWFTSYNSWMEDSDTSKSASNIQCFSTLSEAEQYLISGSIYKNNYNDFFTIRKIYF